MSRLTWLIALCAGCGGVSEERVGALEAQLNQLKTGPADNAKVDAVAERVSALETSVTDSLRKMEEVLAAVQGELARIGAAPAAPAAAPSHGEVWHAVHALLGTPQAGVTAEGDTYTVKRSWLENELQLLAASGKAPKLKAGKKGVVIAGIKPKTLPALLGLENNDIITAIGETALGEPADVAAALRATNGSASVKVTRKKDELILTYKLVD